MRVMFKIARRLALLGGVLAGAAIAITACADDPVEVRSPAELIPAFADTPPPTTGAVLVGAGNTARCGVDTDQATATVLDGIGGTVFTTGDNVYQSGATNEFLECHQPTWGRHKSRTRPAVGDQEYITAGAQGYFSYFGSAAGPAGKGYYSYDLGDWHVVVLNSAISMAAGSPQEQWLRADLAASNRQCTIAYWHHPRFSSYGTSVRAETAPLWDALYQAGAEIVLNGHYRVYERFAPQRPDGTADAQNGIRQFTVGTGGQGTDGFGAARPNSEIRKAGIYGVLKLTLGTGSYSWAFVPIAGQSFTDAGTGSCHGAGSAGPAVTSVVVTPATDTIAAGATTQLTAVARDAAGNVIANPSMSWTSLNPAVATVTNAGLVSAVAAGVASIVAGSGTAADTAHILVTPPAAVVASVTISPVSATTTAGQTVQFSATVRDAAGAILTGQSITWVSSATAVATVNGAGLVTGMTTGTATITASTGGKTGSAGVVVSASVLPGYHVTPNGSSAGDGSSQRPWDLATALAGAGGRVRPGDTVWLRGGVYRGKFTSTVSGAAGAPVVFRQYPGERAIIDGATAVGDNFVVRGAWTVFWGFELMNSSPARTTTSLSNGWRPNLLVNNASHTKYINLVIRDGGVAFFNYTTASDVEVYGCILYNNGWQSIDRGHGHALYIKSTTGPVLLRDNVLFNQFGYGVHAYTNAGSGKLNNIRLEGNVAFNNGTLSSNSTSANILIGGDDTATGDVLAGNLTYFSSGISGTNVKIGYGTTRNGTVQLQGNTMVGGTTVLDMGYWTSATVTANTLVGPAGVVQLNDASTGGKLWSANAHWRDPAALSWRYAGKSYSFSAWRSATGLAATDQALPALPVGVQAVVRPNLYEPGRAMITVYNWARSATVSVALAGVLSPGQSYEVFNVQNLSAPVASGSFTGTVTLPTTGVTPPAPVGMSTSRSPRTGPDFDVFIIRRR